MLERYNAFYRVLLCSRVTLIWHGSLGGSKLEGKLSHRCFSFLSCRRIFPIGSTFQCYWFIGSLFDPIYHLESFTYSQPPSFIVHLCLLVTTPLPWDSHFWSSVKHLQYQLLKNLTFKAHWIAWMPRRLMFGSHSLTPVHRFDEIKTIETRYLQDCLDNFMQYLHLHFAN